MVRRAFSATSRSSKKLDFFEYLQYFNYALNLDFEPWAPCCRSTMCPEMFDPHCEDLTFFEL